MDPGAATTERSNVGVLYVSSALEVVRLVLELYWLIVLYDVFEVMLVNFKFVIGGV